MYNWGFLASLSAEGLTCNKTTEYVCANKLCIAQGLKCDGFDNCGDGSEELLDVHVCGSKYYKCKLDWRTTLWISGFLNKK